MNFELIFHAQVTAYLNGMPWPMIDQVQTALEQLAESPSLVNLPSEPPLVANALMYRFQIVDADGETRAGAVAFRYGQDEQSLHILELLIR